MLISATRSIVNTAANIQKVSITEDAEISLIAALVGKISCITQG